MCLCVGKSGRLGGWKGGGGGGRGKREGALCVFGGRGKLFFYCWLPSQ